MYLSKNHLLKPHRTVKKKRHHLGYPAKLTITITIGIFNSLRKSFLTAIAEKYMPVEASPEALSSLFSVPDSHLSVCYSHRLNPRFFQNTPVPFRLPLLPTTGRIPDFQRLEKCAARRTDKTPLAVLPTAKGVLIWIVISKSRFSSFSYPQTAG